MFTPHFPYLSGVYGETGIYADWANGIDVCCPGCSSWTKETTCIAPHGHPSMIMCDAPFSDTLEGAQAFSSLRLPIQLDGAVTIGRVGLNADSEAVGGLCSKSCSERIGLALVASKSGKSHLLVPRGAAAEC